MLLNVAEIGISVSRDITIELKTNCDISPAKTSPIASCTKGGILHVKYKSLMYALYFVNHGIKIPSVNCLSSLGLIGRLKTDLVIR